MAQRNDDIIPGPQFVSMEFLIELVNPIAEDVAGTLLTDDRFNQSVSSPSSRGGLHNIFVSILIPSNNKLVDVLDVFVDNLAADIARRKSFPAIAAIDTVIVDNDIFAVGDDTAAFFAGIMLEAFAAGEIAFAIKTVISRTTDNAL